MDILWLEHGVDDQITVKCSQSGSHIGYIDQSTVSRMRGDVDEEVRWVAIFKRTVRHPITRRVVGVEIFLVRLKLEPER